MNEQKRPNNFAKRKNLLILPKNNLSRFHQVKSALSYFCRSKTIYQVHSPLVFEFTEKLFEGDRQYYIFEKIERLRKQLLANNNTVQITDFGAGSLTGNKASKPIKDIAGSALTRKQFCELLFKIVNHYRPSTIVELGTSLGLATMYLAAARPASSTVYTLEGNPHVAAIAKQNFQKLELKNIELILGQFEHTLQSTIDQVPKLDLVFFDGNHQKQPTVDYFNQCLAKAHEESIFIFDDIYWSKGMTEAWNEIRQHELVSHSIDLYQFGILFFHKKTAPTEAHTLIPHKWKPWSAGFFG